MRRIFLSILVLALAACAAGQNDESQPKCSISGTVTDSVSGRPIAGVEVTARSLGGSPDIALRSRPLGSQPASSSTDSDGKFQFTGLQPGRYIVRAFRDGYFTPHRAGAGFRSQILFLSAGQNIEDLAISLTPGGAISGHITDESGKPVPDAYVQVMKYSFDTGPRQFNNTAAATATGSGEYRIPNIAPGKYYLRARSPRLHDAKPKGDLAYVPLYYPNAIDQTHAAVLEVRAGEDVGGIDLTFARVHTVSVRGEVVNARTSLPAARAEVTLLSDQGNTAFSPDPVSADDKGNFVFPGVPPGSYVIVAQREAARDDDKPPWGRANVEVGDSNVSDIKLVISRGADLRGSIRIDGNAQIDLTKLNGTLEPRVESAVAAQMPDVDNAVIKADGTFTFHDVPEGSYELSFLPLPQGFYLKSAGSGDAVDSTITVGTGHGTPTLDLILSPAVTDVTGTVVAFDGAFAGASVMLVPEGKRQSEFRNYRFAMSDKSGRFILRGVPPGDYKLFAWEEVERESVMDPEFRRSYENLGRTIHVGSDGQTDVTLSLIPAER